jgi:hypothetical protein
MSCIALLGEGFDHLRIFLPLAIVNILVGAFTPERVARLFLIIESCAIFLLGLFTFLYFLLHERHIT